MTEKTDIFVRGVQDAMDNILRFWTENMQDPRGGYYGRMSSSGEIDESAPKGVVLNTRILWAMSAAYRAGRKEEHLLAATRAKDYMVENFFDHKHGGVYWTLDTDNNRLDARKQAYAQAFAIYALCEYIRATGDESPLNYAKNLYTVLEKELRDRENGGYVEALERDWSECKGCDCSSVKRIGTQIHVLEALSALYEIWPDPQVRESLVSLLEVFVEKIYNPETGHLNNKFDKEWNPLCNCCSFGHEMEASWILLHAAFCVGDICLVNRVRKVSDAAYRAGSCGIQLDGSLVKGISGEGKYDCDRYWWAQAEAVVACLYVWKYRGCPEAARKALRCWDYISSNFLSPKGEWYRRLSADGKPYPEDDLVSADKGPYHNTRMCAEILSILK